MATLSLPDFVFADIDERDELGYPECNEAFRTCMKRRRQGIVSGKKCYELLDMCHTVKAFVERENKKKFNE